MLQTLEAKGRTRSSSLQLSLYILCLQETWLSEDVESIAISGFKLVGRLDRVLGPKRGYGGIAVFVRTTLADIALVEYVSGAERMWCDCILTSEHC